MTISTKELQDNWASIRRILTIRNEREYDQAVKRLNGLLDEIGTNERRPLYGLLDTLGTLIHAYEEKHFEMPEPSGREMLRFFMEEHELRHSDLPELGSPRAVARILKGERELNAGQIRALASSIPRLAGGVHMSWWVIHLIAIINACDSCPDHTIPRLLHSRAFSTHRVRSLLSASAFALSSLSLLAN